MRPEENEDIESSLHADPRRSAGGPRSPLLWSGSYGLCAKVNQFFKNLGAAAPPREATRLRPCGVLLLAWEPWSIKFLLLSNHSSYNLCFAIILISKVWLTSPHAYFITSMMNKVWAGLVLWCELITPDATLMTDVMELWYVSFNSLRLWHIDV